MTPSIYCKFQYLGLMGRVKSCISIPTGLTVAFTGWWLRVCAHGTSMKHFIVVKTSWFRHSGWKQLDSNLALYTHPSNFIHPTRLRLTKEDIFPFLSSLNISWLAISVIINTWSDLFRSSMSRFCENCWVSFHPSPEVLFSLILLPRVVLL